MDDVLDVELNLGSIKLPATSDTLIDEKVLLLLLASFQFSHILDFIIMMPLGPQLMQVFNITSAKFNLLVAAYTCSSGVCSFAASIFIDRFDRRDALLVAYGGLTVGTFCCAISSSYELMLISRALAGAFGGVLGALVFTSIADAIPAERRGKAAGTVMSAFSVASVLGIPLGLYLANNYRWQSPFIFLAGFSFIILLFSTKMLPSMRMHMVKQERPNHGQFLMKMVKQRNQMLSFGLLIVLQIAAFFIIPSLAQFMVFNVGLAREDLAYIYIFGGTFSFFTSRMAGKLADKLGNRKMFIGAAFLSMIPVALISHLGVIPLGLVLVVTTFFFVLNSARFVPAMGLLTSSVEACNRGGFISLTCSFQQMASGLASFGAGMIIYQEKNSRVVNFDVAGYISIGAAFVGVVIVYFMKKK